MSCCIEPFFKLHCQIIRKTKIWHVQTIKVFKSIKKNLVFTRFLLSGLIFFWISNLTNFVNNKPDFPLPVWECWAVHMCIKTSKELNMVRAMSFQKSRWERGGDTDIGHVVCIWDFPDHIKSYSFFIIRSISNSSVLKQ